MSMAAKKKSKPPTAAELRTMIDQDVRDLVEVLAGGDYGLVAAVATVIASRATRVERLEFPHGVAGDLARYLRADPEYPAEVCRKTRRKG